MEEIFKILLELYLWTCLKLDCIYHDLLVAKLHAHGLSIDAITFIYSYMKRRKQRVKINDIESLFKILLSGVSQGPS